MARNKDTEKSSASSPRASTTRPTGARAPVSSGAAEGVAGWPWRLRWLLWGSIAGLAAVTVGLGYARLERLVEAKYATGTQPPVVVLKDRPAWMNERLAARILEVARPSGISSAFDHDELVRIHDRLVKSPDVGPWIEQVRQIRRTYRQAPGDTIELDLGFRAPVALVRWDDAFWLVDSRGVKLPERFDAEQIPKVIVGPDGRLVVRVVDGVHSGPPSAGQTWAGKDLQAGLEMLRLLHDKEYAQEIVRVDVSNFTGRRDNAAAHLVLFTRYNTEIRWGRPISATDYYVEASPAKKLEYLQRMSTEFGRVDARQPWVDLRLDTVVMPTPKPAEEPATAGSSTGAGSTVGGGGAIPASSRADGRTENGLAPPKPRSEPSKPRTSARPPTGVATTR